MPCAQHASQEWHQYTAAGGNQGPGCCGGLVPEPADVAQRSAHTQHVLLGLIQPARSLLGACVRGLHARKAGMGEKNAARACTE